MKPLDNTCVRNTDTDYHLKQNYVLLIIYKTIQFTN
jgi:hypothetical protein